MRHNETTNKMATMNSELWNEIGFKQSKIKELQETIQGQFSKRRTVAQRINGLDLPETN